MNSNKQLEFDPDALHDRYQRERDKRVRKEGARQYADIGEKFSELGTDPYVSTGFSRPSIEEELDVVVLGGGLSGLTTAAKLRDAGIDSFRIVEQGGDFGGAWYWNRYPGVRCDIESYIYMPLLEEVGTIPSEKYARGAEILAHCRKIGEKYDLYAGALFQTSITDIRWSEEATRWLIRTSRGDLLKARHLMVSNGPFHLPKLPDIPGIRDFNGHAFHTSRWDYNYTKGDSTGGLIGLEGKRVAVIGTGATGVQVIPVVARYAKHLYVVQRTPSTVDARNNRSTDVEWFKAQTPGWQRRRMDNFLLHMLGQPQADNLVNDCWTDLTTILAGWMGDDNAPVAEATPEMLQQLADYAKMEQVRRRISAVVVNQDTAEKLKPWFNLFCKRPTFSDEYLETFNLPNVTLLDTDGRGIERITGSAVEFADQSYDVDCIIFATGFEVAAYSYKTGGYELVGRDGANLRDKWQDGVKTVHGTRIAGFPNFQIIGAITQAATFFNFPHVMAYQAEHAVAVVKWALQHDADISDMTEEDERRWQAELQRHSVDRSEFYADCTPGYYNNEGKQDDGPQLLATTYGGGPIEYVAELRRWRERELHDPQFVA